MDRLQVGHRHGIPRRPPIIPWPREFQRRPPPALASPCYPAANFTVATIPCSNGAVSSNYAPTANECISLERNTRNKNWAILALALILTANVHFRVPNLPSQYQFHVVIVNSN